MLTLSFRFCLEIFWFCKTVLFPRSRRTSGSSMCLPPRLSFHIPLERFAVVLSPSLYVCVRCTYLGRWPDSIKRGDVVCVYVYLQVFNSHYLIWSVHMRLSQDRCRCLFVFWDNSGLKWIMLIIQTSTYVE